jgi:hypothetical protein
MKFLERLSLFFGEKHLQKRLQRWEWSMSTAFSGVGCAEQAHPQRKAI